MLGEDYHLMTELGRQLGASGSTAEAERVLSKYFHAEPDRELAPFLLALLYQEDRHWQKASQYALHVLNIHPGRPEAVLVLANAHIATGRTVEGLDLLEHYCLRFPFSRQRWKYAFLCLKSLKLLRVVRFFGRWVKSLVRWGNEKVLLES